MFRRMTEAFGYSVRQLAQKVGKDKGYIENRLRLSDAPADVRELVSLRKDTISHAYELMKIGDERVRRRLAKRIAAGELSLAKLRLITVGKPLDDVTKRRSHAVEPDLPAGVAQRLSAHGAREPSWPMGRRPRRLLRGPNDGADPDSTGELAKHLRSLLISRRIASCRPDPSIGSRGASPPVVYVGINSRVANQEV